MKILFSKWHVLEFGSVTMKDDIRHVDELLCDGVYLLLFSVLGITIFKVDCATRSTKYHWSSVVYSPSSVESINIEFMGILPTIFMLQALHSYSCMIVLMYSMILLDGVQNKYFHCT